MRLELLALLLACAWGLRLLLARLLEPRLGAPAAERAALTAALLSVLHPRALLADADLVARADLIGLTLATWAAALFLSGRQRHAETLTTVSPVLFLASGLFSHVGAPLVAIVAVAEFACVRRHRKRALRLRTSATTAAVFGAAAGLPVLLPLGGEGLSSGASQDGLAQGGRALMALFLPLSGAGIWPSALAGIVLLTALWPAFRAARHAPRLWSGMLLVWCPGLLVALWFTVREGCELPAVCVWCAGLALAVTAGWQPASGVRVGIVALGLALLGHLALRPLSAQARAEGALWAELAPIARRHVAPILVVDPPPESVPSLGWLFHPRLLGTDAGAADFVPGRVRGLTSAAFLALASSEPSSSVRAEGTVVVARASALGQAGSELVVRVLERQSDPPPERITWRGLTHAPVPALDPMDWESARIVAELAGTPRQIDQLGWDGHAGETGVLGGIVSERAGRFTAEFDLSSALAWRLAGEVRGLRVERGVRGIERAELEARLPLLALGGEPRARGDDWLFTPAPVAEGPGGRGTYALRLLALSDLELLEVGAERDALGNLEARGAEAFRARKGGGDLVWLLDYRIGPRVVQRARGVVH